MIDSSRAGESVVEIGPPVGIPGLGLDELWRRRGIFGFLVWRDIKVRYAQTLLGIAWVLLQPLLTMTIFAVVFGRLMNVPSEGVPYPAFALVALVAWTFFSTAVGGASGSLLQQRDLIGKVYFPRLFVPLAPVASAYLDLAIALALVIPVLGLLGLIPTPLSLLLLPGIFLVGGMAAAAVGAGLGALSLRYRDTRYVVPFLLQAWLFASPVAYSTILVPEPYRLLYGLNPMAGVIEAARWAVLGTSPHTAVFVVSAASAVLMMAVALVYFRIAERTFLDVA